MAKKDEHWANAELEKFYGLMQEQRCAEASQLLERCKANGLAELVFPAALDRANSLVAISEGRFEGIDIGELVKNFPNAAAGALLCADHVLEADDPAIESALMAFPDYLIGGENLRLEIRSLWNKRKAIGPGWRQIRAWEILTSPPKLECTALKFKYDPFHEHRAEWEVNVLFAKHHSLFWMDHPLYDQISSEERHLLVGGMPGTGKTALAMALGRYWHPVDVIAIYLDQHPPNPRIRRAFCRELFQAILEKPMDILEFGDNQLNRLHRVLYSCLPKDDFRADIEEKQKSVTVEERTALERLKRALANEIPSIELDDQEWSQQFMSCAHMLGFKRAWIVIDTKRVVSREWLENEIEPALAPWQQEKIFARIFVLTYEPTFWFNSPERKTLTTLEQEPLLFIKELRWEPQGGEDPFVSMLCYRFLQVDRYEKMPPSELEALIPTDVLHAMLKRSERNPARFIQLWQKLLPIVPADGKLTVALLDRLQ